MSSRLAEAVKVPCIWHVIWNLAFCAEKKLPASSRREAGLLRLLEHPYLPKMIDYTERGNFCYIIMEYIHGRSLEEYMQEGYVFSIEEILCIGDVTLQVLEYFHSRKPAVFYGDLKPANIMMTDQKRLYLVDFGSAVFSYSASYKKQREQEDMLPLNSCMEK